MTEKLEVKVAIIETSLNNIRDVLINVVKKEEEQRIECITAINNLHDTLQKEIDSLHDELIKYKGFVGAVVYVITGLGFVLMFFKDYILRWFTR